MSATLTLYETTDALAQVMVWLDEAEGEWTPEIEALMEAAGKDFGDKVERVALKVRELKATAGAIKEESDRLAARAKAVTRNAESLSAYLHRHLELAGTTKVVGLLATVALQNNPPALEVDETQWDEVALRGLASVQPDAVTITPERFTLNKRVFIEHAKAGRPLPVGMELVVRQSLRIR